MSIGAGNRYRPDIDGIRAIAIISVVMFHIGFNSLPGGFVGVDIFFVISGFLVGRIIYSDLNANRWSIIAFYTRRARRILPALLFVIIIFMILGFFVLSSQEYRRFSISSMAAVLAISNIRFWRSADYFSPDAHGDPMLMTWSLGVEEQFYIIFPIILMTIRNISWKLQLTSVVFISVLSFILSFILSSTNPTAAFYLLPTRAWELGLGAALAIWKENRRVDIPIPASNALAIAGVAMIFLAVTQFDGDMTFPGYAAALPTLGTAALILSERSAVNRRVLSHPAVVFIGLISYSWYLWHWPIITFYRLLRIQEPEWWELVAAMLASAALATVTWRFLESPFRRAKGAGTVALARYGAACAITSCLLAAIVVTGGLPSRLSAGVQTLDRTIAAHRAFPCLAGWAASVPDGSADCVSAGPADRTIAILGDSHAAALWPGIRTLAREQGWGAAVYTKMSCRPLEGVTVWRRDRASLAQDCARYMQSAVDLVRNDPAISVVVLAGFWFGPLENPNTEHYEALHEAEGEPDGAELLRVGLERIVRTLSSSGKRVLLAEDVPYLKYDPVSIEMSSSIPLRRALVEMLSQSSPYGRREVEIIRQDARTDGIVEGVARSEGVDLIPLRRSFCTPAGCRDRSGAGLLYFDRSHLSPEGAIRALSPFRSMLFDTAR